jgi:O-antigen/teichoic acid export membrane protein
LWFTIAASVLAVVIIHPVTMFCRVPRDSITWVALGLVVVGMWGAVASSWCTGLSQFHLMAGLGLTSVATRLATGAGLAMLWARAESGVLASILGGLVVVAVVFWRDAGMVRFSPSVRLILQRDFLLYFLAALAVCGGQFLFLQADILVAQRHFTGETLGQYSAAGLFGRAVIYLASPVLTVLFTARSGQERSNRQTVRLVLLYVGLLVIGVGGVAIAAPLLCRLLLGRIEEATLALMPLFAVAMVPVGIVQAAGMYALASRRLVMSVVFGLFAIIYAGTLMWLGGSPSTLVRLVLIVGSFTSGGFLLSLMLTGRGALDYCRSFVSRVW